jgi:hypothetical protein
VVAGALHATAEMSYSNLLSSADKPLTPLSPSDGWSLPTSHWAGRRGYRPQRGRAGQSSDAGTGPTRAFIGRALQRHFLSSAWSLPADHADDADVPGKLRRLIWVICVICGPVPRSVAVV